MFVPSLRIEVGPSAVTPVGQGNMSKSFRSIRSLVSTEFYPAKSVPLTRKMNAALALTFGLSACSGDPSVSTAPRALQVDLAAASAVASPCETTQRTRTLSNSVRSVKLTATPVSPVVGDLIRVQATAQMSDQSEVSLDPSLIRGGDDAVIVREGNDFRSRAAGVSVLSVRCGNQTATSQVTVTAGPTTPTTPTTPTPVPAGDSGSAVAVLSVVRFDGGSGSAVVSNGIPLIPGAIRSQDVPNLRVYLRGVEVPARISELHGRFSDSTVRAVQVQFAATLTDQDTLPASLRLVAARTAQPFSATATSTAPAVVALPTDPTYLRKTLVAGRLPAFPLVGVDQTLIDHDNDYFIAHEIDWSRCGPLWSCSRASQYDRGLMIYEAWVRTGDPKYYRRASLVVKSYIDTYVAPNQSVLPPWQSYTTSIAINYLVTGDSLSRVHVRRIAEILAFGVRDVAAWKQGVSYPDVDPRNKAKAFMSVTDAYIVGAGNPIVGSNGDVSNMVSPGTIDKYLDDLKVAQYASGCFCTVGFGNGQMNYMAGLLMQNLIRYHEVYKPDARIEGLVKAAADYTWANEWLPDSVSFKYASVVATFNGNGMGPVPAPDLNGFLAPAYGWLSKKYGSSYMNKYLTIMGGLQTQRNLWMQGYGKQFDEGFLGFAQSITWSGIR